MTAIAPPVAAVAAAPDAPMHLGTRDHLWQLDVLRAAAILMVFGYHLLQAVAGHDAMGFNAAGWLTPHDGHSALWAFYPFAIGDSGVTLFFVLSGFCIHHSYLQARQRAQNANPAAPPSRFHFLAFVWRRAWRIYPAYLVAIVFALLLEGRTLAGWWQGKGDILYHLLLIHNLKGDYFYSINPAFWSLGVEWQFYLIYPLLLWLRRITGTGGAVAAAIAISAACQFWFTQKGLDAPRFDDDKRYLAFVNFPLVTWFEWCWGALVAEAWQRRRAVFRVPGWVAFLFCAAVFAASFHQQSHPIATMCWGLAYAVILEKYLHRRPSSRLERWLIPVGLCSYSLYLLHQPLIGIGIHWLRAQNVAGPEAVQLACWGLVLLALIFALAWVSFRWLEMPGVALGSRWWKRLTGGVPPVAKVTAAVAGSAAGS